MNETLDSSSKLNPKILRRWPYILSGILLAIILGCFGLLLVGAWLQGGLTSTGLLALVIIITVVMMSVGGVIVIVRRVVNLLTGRKAIDLSMEKDGSEPADRNLNPVQERGKPKKYAASLIVLGIGLFGLVANGVVVMLMLALILATSLAQPNLGPFPSAQSSIVGSSLIQFTSELIQGVAILVGFLATKLVFEKTKHSENQPIFWSGAKIGMISGAIAILPPVLPFIFFIILAFVDGVEGKNLGFLGMVVILTIPLCLFSGVYIFLSTIIGGITATKLLCKPNNPTEPTSVSESQASLAVPNLFRSE